MADPPEKLLRFRPPSEYTLENLRKGQIWFSKPISFNDPFDCAVRVVDAENISEEAYWELFRHFQEMIGRPDLLEKQCVRNGQLTDRFKIRARDGFRDAYEEQMQKMLHQRGAVCFSAVSPDHQDSILQWSHYADGHKGICLEFDTDSSLFQEGEVFQVRYYRSVPLIEPYEAMTSGEGVLEPMVTTKADCWEYEREWRLYHMEGDRPRGYATGCLKAVYLGCEVDVDFREEVESILQGSSTELYEVQRSEKQFRLQAESVEIE
ncbi:hypothetical protein GGQ03_002343 [Salinibacter ruber]|uniref:DUF2971 domain-containing protein n=1 Tax=Salinibacter ruber TaxID=146919 RepID=UPI002169DB76|nr:DUF2971 domain-containing protein [Salinibacter ruber]MCS4155049.1 hypothetical protein [Salinibacter ruber]